jgi:Abortive infection alpha
MSEEQGTNKTAAIIQAATEFSKAIPVYQDALQPMMKETGKALSVVGRTVNVALAPIRGLVWGAEKVEEWLATKVSEKLERTSAQDIVQPDLSVAGPIIEALKFNGHKPELSEMYASLLAGAMQSSSQAFAHPTFVEKIRSMTTIDARIFSAIASKEAVPTLDISREEEGEEGRAPVAEFFNPIFYNIGLSLGFPSNGLLGMLQSSIENLDGLGLIQASSDGELTSEVNRKMYQDIEQDPVCKSFRDLSVPAKHRFVFTRSYVRTTQIGKNFFKITSL